jgi:hypothetical protein
MIFINSTVLKNKIILPSYNPAFQLTKEKLSNDKSATINRTSITGWSKIILKLINLLDAKISQIYYFMFM